MFKNSKILLIPILILTLALAGYFFWQGQKPLSLVNNSQASSSSPISKLNLLSSSSTDKLNLTNQSTENETNSVDEVFEVVAVVGSGVNLKKDSDQDPDTFDIFKAAIDKFPSKEKIQAGEKFKIKGLTKVVNEENWLVEISNIEKINENLSILSGGLPVLAISANSTDLVNTTTAAPCQPDLFNPRSVLYRNLYKKTPLGSRGNSQYQSQGFNFQINGWDKENENKINLPAPYSVDSYNFGCASSFSYVLEIKKDGQRKYLFTQVMEFKFDESGKKLFLVNFVKNGNKWQKLSRIVNLETGKKFKLSENCANYNPIWQGDKLLTALDQKETGKVATTICLWNNAGSLVKKYNVDMYWSAVNRSYLNGIFGLLPKNKDILYTISLGFQEKDNCELTLTDTKSDQVKKFVSTCTQQNLGVNFTKLIDLNNITSVSQKVKFLNTDGKWVEVSAN